MDNPAGKTLVFRGGGWASDRSDDLRASSRFNNTPDVLYFIGCRLARRLP
jgi:formylglycine-generating enzyme required for sulfatase activity